MGRGQHGFRAERRRLVLRVRDVLYCTSQVARASLQQDAGRPTALLLAHGGIVIFDSDVIASTGYTCSFDYGLQEWLALAEIIGSAAVWPLIDNTRIGIWGGRFGAMFLDSWSGTACPD